MKNFIKKQHKTTLLVLMMMSTMLSAKASIFTLTIKEELAKCIGVAPRTYYQVKYRNSKNWENFYTEITGFKYETGYRYVLSVKRIKRKNIPADGSAYTYQLVKILKRTKMGKRENPALTFIAEYSWKLIQLNGKTLEHSRAFLIFDPKTNRIHGNTGCNNLMGSFTIEQTAVSFGPLATTRMACDETSSKLEAVFIQILGESKLSYDVAEQTLNFYKSDKLVMMFGMAPLANK